DAFLDREPIVAAVRGLPGQVPSSGVDYARIFRIDRHGLHIPQFLMVVRRNPKPGAAGICRFVDTFKGSRHEHARILAGNRKTPYRLLVYVGERRPGRTAIGRTIDSTATVGLGPSCGDHHAGVMWMDR